MSKNYTKEELRLIAEELVEDLRECENGTNISTSQLIKAVGYDQDSFDLYDLFDIHAALLRAARSNYITLDMSAHKDKVEGLPF